MSILRSLVPLVLCLRCASAAGSALTYSSVFSSLGGPSDVAITAMTSDKAGNVYLAGWIEQPTLPVTPGVVQPLFGGGTCTSGSNGPTPTPSATFPCPDAFVIKLDQYGKLAFATYLGGSGFDQATSIALDANNNIYVAGVTTGFPTISGSKYTGGATFIAALNKTATGFLYTASIPGTGSLPLMMPFGPNVPSPDITMSMAVDSAGSAYFAAKASTGFPVTSNAISTRGGVAVGKLDPSGQSLTYATYLGGTAGDDFAGGVAIDSVGALYVTGSTSSSDFPVTAGVLQNALPDGITNAFVAKVDPSGSRLDYATYLGQNSFTHGNEIAVDSNGDAFVLGTLNSTSFPVTPGAYQTDYSAGAAFLARLTGDASALVYATYVSSMSLPPNLLTVDPIGDAYISGQAGPGFAVSNDALQPCRAGGADAFVLELSPAGKWMRSTYLGGSQEDIPQAIQVLPDQTVLLAGLTLSPDFLVTTNSLLLGDGNFVARFQITDASYTAQPCSILAPENSANLQDVPIAPGELVTFWGLRFGPDQGVGGKPDSSGKFGNQLAGVRVFFDEFPAPILYAQSLQINAQAPWELAGRPAAYVHVEYNGVSTRTGDVRLQASEPALFHAQYGNPQGAILNHDGAPNSASNPAAAGSVVSVFGTGGGPTNPGSLTGAVAPLKSPATLALPATVTIDGTTNAEVVYAGVAPTLISGLFQINFRLPAGLPASATHRIDVQIGSFSTVGLISVTVATK